MATAALRVEDAVPYPASPLVRLVPAQVEVGSRYRRSRGTGPVAAGASVAIVAALTGALAWMNIHVPARPERSLTVVALSLMPDEPPPPPPAESPKVPQVARPVVVAPVPSVRTPVPPSAIAIAETPTPAAPRAVPQTRAESGTAPAAVTVAPAPAGPVESGDLSARMIAASPPAYPTEARRRREQGVVKLAVLVGEDGRVETVSVAASSGSYHLDRAALGAVRRWRWSPVIRDGSAVMVRGFVTIPFVLKG